MVSIIYWIGKVVSVVLLIYIILCILKLVLKLQIDPAISAKSMPALRPIPIPTKNQKTFIHKLLAFIFEVRKWELVENWHYQLDEVTLIIPKGFRFDGASIPRPFWAILNPVGLLLIPGLLHDYGYKYDQLWQVGPRDTPIAYKPGAGKDVWDDLFKKIGKDVNGLLIINLIAWLAVALGGDRAWVKHRKADLTAKEPV